MDAPQPPQQPPPPPPGPQGSQGPWGEPGQWAAPQPGPGAVAGAQPPSISLAVRLMQIGAVLSVIGILLTFLQRDAIRDQIAEDADPPMTSDEIDTAVAAGLGFAVVLGLIGAGVWLWMAHANGQGKTWARTTATVLGGLNMLFTLVGVAMGQATALSLVTSVVGLALAVTILILLYRPDANRFYDVMSGRTGY